MLVLSRKSGESIKIGDSVTISIVRIQGNRVQVGIEAPRSVPVHRSEVLLDASDDCPQLLSVAEFAD